MSQVGLQLVEFALAVLLGNMVTDENLHFVKKHSVDMLDRILGCLGHLVLDKSIATGAAVHILRALAGQDAAKGSESALTSPVANGRIEILSSVPSFP